MTMNYFSPNIEVSKRTERNAVRVVILDACLCVLLVRIQDSSNPKFPRTWELPGGGVNKGETLAAGAVREVKEETGLDVPEPALIGPLWRRDVLYGYRGESRLQHEAIFAAHILESMPRLDFSGRDIFEETDFLEYRWWPLSELKQSTDTFYPRSLPSHIATLAAGQYVDEPVEVWPDFG